MKKNQKGSALLWAIVVIGVLSILIAGSLTIAYSYYHRTLQTNSKRQAYLTAKGVVEDIAENIQNGNEEYLSLFMDTSKEEYTPILKEGQKVTLTVNVPSVANIGEITESYITINKIDKSMKGYITVGVIAEYDSQKYEVKADLKLGYINGIGDKWQLIRYYQYGDIDETNNNITKGRSLYDEIYRLFPYKSDGKKMQEELKSQKGWDIYEKDVANYKELNYMNNTNIRFFYCYRNESKTFEKFDNSEVKKKTVIDPYTGQSVDLSEFLTKDYYIQPFLCNASYDTGIIYASTDNTPSGNGGSNFNTSANLFYYNSNWYYVGNVKYSDINIEYDKPSENPKPVVLTLFDDAKAGVGNLAKDRWERFVVQYLKPENIIQ